MATHTESQTSHHPLPTTTPTRKARPTSIRAAWPAILALSLTMLVEMIDNSVLNVALPTIGRDLVAGTTGLQWMVAAYSLTFGGLLLVGGSLGDRLGRRRMLLAGLTGFGATSALVALVSTPGQFIALRAVTGVFAALVTPGTMSLLFRLFDDTTLRQRAIGIIVSVAMVGFALGPTLGGLAIAQVSWKWLILVNVPVTLTAIIGVRWGIPADDPSELRAVGGDLPGAVLSISTLSLGLYTFTLGVSDGWLAVTTLGCAALAVLSGVLFVIRERRTSEPMLDLRLLARPTVRGSALLQAAVMVAMVGVGFSTTQLFQFAWSWSPMRAGLGSLPLVAGMFVAAPISDALTARAGHRRTALVGAGLVLAALAGFIAGISHGYLPVAVSLMVMAVGTRLVMTTSAIALLEALPEDHTSIGSALNDTSQELGNSIGVAVVGTIMAAVVGVALPGTAWPAALVTSFVHSQQLAYAVLAGIVAAITFVGARSLTDSRTTEEAH